jgi:hypothetical protein
MFNDGLWLNNRLWLNGCLWLNDHISDIVSSQRESLDLLKIDNLLNIDNLWEGQAELHLWRIHDWILLRSTRRNRNRACIDHFLHDD